MSQASSTVNPSSKQQYLSQLLQKNISSARKAQQYISIKTVNIQQQIQSGEQQISKQQKKIVNINTNNTTSTSINNNLNKIEKNRQNVNFIKNKIEKEKLKIQKQLEEIDSQLNKEKQKQSKKAIITDEERLKFLQQKRKQQLLIKKNRQQSVKKQQQKQLLLRKQQQKQHLLTLQQQKQRKHQQTLSKLKQIQQRRRLRELENKKTNQILKQKSKQKILAQKIQQEYKQNQNLLLEERKKKLQQLREFHKPMDKKEIDQHVKRMEMVKLQKLKIKNQQKMKIKKEESNNNMGELMAAKSGYYRSVFHEIIQKEKKEKEYKSQQQIQLLKQLKSRQKKYAQQIKMYHKPVVDQKLKEQIQKRAKSGASILSKNNIDMKMKGQQYLNFAKQYGNKYKKQQNQNNSSTLQKTQPMLSSDRNIRTQQIDYLTQLRKKNQQSRLKRSVTSAQDFISSIQKKNLPKQQKQKKIIEYAQSLERKAKEKQKLMGLNKGNNGNGDKKEDQIDEELDKLYLLAIQAKLKVLEK